MFDLLVNRGLDVTQQPLAQCKAALAKLLKRPPPSIMYVAHFDPEDASRVFKEAVIPLELEGLVRKRADSVYLPGRRSPDWVKMKRKGGIPPDRFKRGS